MAEQQQAPPKYKSNLYFMHGEYIRVDKSTDAYVGFLKNLDTGQSVMKIVDNPVVNIYVTKPEFRIYTQKKEWSPKKELDEYTTRYLFRGETIWNALNQDPANPRWRTMPFVRLREQMSSPYVYGADIDFGVRMKHRLQQLNGDRKPLNYNVGFLDIETDVNGTNQIILITFVNGDGNTYVGVLKEFFSNAFVPATEDTLKVGTNYFVKTSTRLASLHDIFNGAESVPFGLDMDTVKSKLAAKLHIPEDKVQIFKKGSHQVKEVEDMWKNTVEPAFHNALDPKPKVAYEQAQPIQLHVEILEDEVSLIKWVFDNIHACRPDFVTIWNIAYDIPYILDRLAFRGIDPCDVLCSPDIPKKYRVCKWREDKSGEHITDNWSWLHLTDYTRYIDAMCCYGRIRKAQTREPSYTLNAIGDKELGTGKLEFNENSDHHIMQREHKVEYTVYNIVDVVLLRTLELKNNDIRTMMMLIGDSMPEDFSKQSVMLKNSFFVYLDPLGGVPGSVGERLDDPWDKYIFNKGGQVLSPDLTNGTGVSILTDSDAISYVHKLVCDIDVSSMYPSLMSALNCTRETKLSTILYLLPAKDHKALTKPVPITIEQIDAIPEVAAGLAIYNNESLKMEKRKQAMAFMSERVQDFLYQYIYIQSNAVQLAEKYLGLPGYEEMDRLIEQQLLAG